MDTQQTNIKIAEPRHIEGELNVSYPAPRDIWRQLAAADPNVLVMQTPAWMDALTKSGTYQDASRLYRFADGRMAVLPLARKKGLPNFLTTEQSMPDSWGMGGLVSAEPLDAADVAAVFGDLRQQKVLATSIRINPLMQGTWDAAKPGGVTVKPMLAHVLDLQDGFQAVWSEQFRGEARTAVRKAERSGLVVELDTTGRLIPVFYQLFEQSVDRWAKMQHEPIPLSRWRAHRRDPIEKLQAMARCIGNAFHLWVAWKDGEPAAAILVLLGKNASYTRGAMNQDLAGPTRANQLLHRMAIEEACLAGCRYYHMGESGSSSSLARFKSQFGARPISYGEYWIEKLPVKAVDRKLRGVVKKLIGFKDAS